MPFSFCSSKEEIALCLSTYSDHAMFTFGKLVSTQLLTISLRDLPVLMKTCVPLLCTYQYSDSKSYLQPQVLSKHTQGLTFLPGLRQASSCPSDSSQELEGAMLRVSCSNPSLNLPLINQETTNFHCEQCRSNTQGPDPQTLRSYLHVFKSLMSDAYTGIHAWAIESYLCCQIVGETTCMVSHRRETGLPRPARGSIFSFLL